MTDLIFPVTFDEELVFYDYPQLFTVMYGNGYQRGLACVTDENDKFVEVLMVLASTRRLQAVKANCTTLHEAFLYPENERYYRIKIINWNDMYAEPWQFSGIDNFPLNGTRLNFKSKPPKVYSSRHIRRAIIRSVKGIEHRPAKSWKSNLYRTNAEINLRNAELNSENIIKRVIKSNLSHAVKQRLFYIIKDRKGLYPPF